MLKQVHAFQAEFTQVKKDLSERFPKIAEMARKTALFGEGQANAL
jgi:hypothetical protein